MSEKIAALIEEVKGLTVVELAELVHALEDTFGVSAAAAAVAAPAAAAGAEAGGQAPGASPAGSAGRRRAGTGCCGAAGVSGCVAAAAAAAGHHAGHGAAVCAAEILYGARPHGLVHIPVNPKAPS